jgi:hypothetical protein
LLTVVVFFSYIGCLGYTIVVTNCFLEAKKKYMKEKVYFLHKSVSQKGPEGLMFVKQYGPQKSDDLSGSLIFIFPQVYWPYIRNREID